VRLNKSLYPGSLALRRDRPWRHLRQTMVTLQNGNEQMGEYAWQLKGHAGVGQVKFGSCKETRPRPSSN
jgi:hypothetical protein